MSRAPRAAAAESEASPRRPAQAPPGPQPPGPIDLLLDGLVTRFTEPYAAALPSLRGATARSSRKGWPRRRRHRWLWFACPVTPEPLAPELWDDETWHELATRAVRLARDAGALAVLPNALTYRACMHVLAGEFAAASALIEEAYAIAEATGNAPLRYPSLLLAVWRGQEPAALSVIEAGIQDASSQGPGKSDRFCPLRDRSAVQRPRPLSGRPRRRTTRACVTMTLGLFGWALTELVEAGARTEQPRARLRRPASARRTNPRQRHGLGAGDRGAFAGAAEPRRGRRAPVPGGDRAPRPHPHTRGAEPARISTTASGSVARIAGVDAREQLRRAYDAFALMGAEGVRRTRAA